MSRKSCLKSYYKSNGENITCFRTSIQRQQCSKSMSSSHLLDGILRYSSNIIRETKYLEIINIENLSKYLHSSLYSNKLFPISKAKIRYKDPQTNYSAILYDLFYESIWQLTRTTDVTWKRNVNSYACLYFGFTAQ